VVVVMMVLVVVMMVLVVVVMMVVMMMVVMMVVELVETQNQITLRINPEGVLRACGRNFFGVGGSEGK
jgi:hypothetical protein